MPAETGRETEHQCENLKTRLFELTREAVNTGETLLLIESLREINEVLTGIEGADLDPTEMGERRLQEKVSNFLCEAQEGHAIGTFYLGDSGLSRLIIKIDDDTILIGLTPNSSLQVRARWDTLE